jgi:hypothetical protein
MELLKINIHSFVDLITNSSSELFVCDTQKSLETVKRLIEKIVKNYYDEIDQPCPDVWEDIFKLPEISEHDFDINDYPDKKVLEFNNTFLSDIPEYNEAQVKISKLNPFPEHCNKMSWDDRENNPDYIKWIETDSKLREKYLEPFWVKKEEYRKKVVDFFKARGIPNPQTLISYDIMVKRGDILLYSQDDNTVPYECWDRITGILNATHYHLG